MLNERLGLGVLCWAGMAVLTKGVPSIGVLVRVRCVHVSRVFPACPPSPPPPTSSHAIFTLRNTSVKVMRMDSKPGGGTVRFGTGQVVIVWFTRVWCGLARVLVLCAFGCVCIQGKLV